MTPLTTRSRGQIYRGWGIVVLRCSQLLPIRSHCDDTPCPDWIHLVYSPSSDPLFLSSTLRCFDVWEIPDLASNFEVRSILLCANCFFFVALLHSTPPHLSQCNVTTPTLPPSPGCLNHLQQPHQTWLQQHNRAVKFDIIICNIQSKQWKQSWRWQGRIFFPTVFEDYNTYNWTTGLTVSSY